jgi:nucleoid-associated protein
MPPENSGLTRLIAHRLDKEPGTQTAAIRDRKEVLPVKSALAATFLDQLRDGFQKRNPVAGVFKSTAGTQPPFQQLLSRYLDSQSNKSFIAFSKDATLILKEEISKQQASTGGYIVFAEYSANGEGFLLTGLLSTLANPNFDESLNLVSSVALDMQHLRHGARMRLQGVSENVDGAIQFISQQTKGVSEYFVEFIGCKEVTRPEAQGRQLHTALEQWAQQEQLNDVQRGQLMSRAYTYWQDCRRERQQMTLTALANVLSPERSGTLLRHLGNENLGLAGEFSPPPPSIMKRFIRFAFNAAGLKLEFDRNQWRDRVDLNQERRTLTIREVPDELIAAFKEEG